MNRAVIQTAGASVKPLRLRLGVVVAPLIFALAGCGFGRAGAPAQLFDLGPPPGATAASASTGAMGATDATGAMGGMADPSSAVRTASSSRVDGPSASAPAPRREPVAVSFSAAQMLTDTGVIWRIGDSASPHSYATSRWAAPPAQLVQQRVIEKLSAVGPVVQDGVDPRAPLLQVTLTRFEQVYAEDGKSSVGQVAMQAVLVRDHSVVDSVRLARSAPAPTQDAQGGVIALRAATDAAAGDLSAWLERRLAAAGDGDTRYAPSHRAMSLRGAASPRGAASSRSAHGG